MHAAGHGEHDARQQKRVWVMTVGCCVCSEKRCSDLESLAWGIVMDSMPASPRAMMASLCEWQRRLHMQPVCSRLTMHVMGAELITCLGSPTAVLYCLSVQVGTSNKCTVILQQ